MAATELPARRPGSGPRREISVPRKLAYGALCALLTLVLCEGAVRARAYLKYGRRGASGIAMTTDPTSGLVYPMPGYSSTGRNTSLSINSLGFRGEEIPVAKPQRTLRIACVGASTTFCGDVSNDQATWPHLLQLALARRYPALSVQVVNAGVPGYSAATSLKNLRVRVLPLQPDLVVYYEANNDIAFDAMELARQRGLPSSSQRQAPRGQELLSRYSLLADLVYKNARILGAMRDVPGGKLSSLPAEMPKRYVGELAKIHGLLQEQGVPLVLSTFLVSFRRDQERATQLGNASVAFYYMPSMSLETLLDAFDLYNAAILEYARSRGVPVVDDRDAVPADSEHYADWCHLRDAGARRMAERFYRFFETSGILEPLVEQKLR